MVCFNEKFVSEFHGCVPPKIILENKARKRGQCGFSENQNQKNNDLRASCCLFKELAFFVFNKLVLKKISKLKRFIFGMKFIQSPPVVPKTQKKLFPEDRKAVFDKMIAFAKS